MSKSTPKVPPTPTKTTKKPALTLPGLPRASVPIKTGALVVPRPPVRR